MKRLLIVMMFLSVAAAALWAADMMSVQVNTAQVRSTPSFLGAQVASLSYGDRVEILEEGRGWLRVQPETGPAGWVQESALTKKRIVLSAGGAASTGASSEEVALAGKGFNEEVEREYRAESDLDFAWVDRMEGFGLPTDDLVAFLRDGDLEGVVR